MKINIYVVIYLAAIVSANLTVSYFGPPAANYCALIFIGLDLSLRDHLHDKWGGDWVKLWGLVSAGSLITIALNVEAINIAIASAAAFGLAFIADAVVYALLKDKKFLLRANASNIAGAATDSVIFPTLAFGAFMPLIILGQFAAKLVGGFVASLVIEKLKTANEETRSAEFI